MITFSRRELKFGWYVAHGASSKLMDGVEMHTNLVAASAMTEEEKSQAFTSKPIEAVQYSYGSIDSRPWKPLPPLFEGHDTYSADPSKQP